MKKIIIAVLILLVVAGLWYLNRPEPVSVRTAVVEQGRVEATVANTRAGTIMACQRSKLSMSLGGRVEVLNVDNGDKVKKGDVLLQLWADDRLALVARAEAALVAAQHQEKQVCYGAGLDKREANRQATLLKKKLTSEEQADKAHTKALVSGFSCEAAKANIEMAEAELALQNAQLAQMQLVAPFDGVVAEINGEVGEYVTPSPPGVATPPAIDLINDSCLYVRAPIDEVDAAAIELGMPARVTMDAFRGRVFPATVTRIAPYVKDYEKQARTVDVEVVLDELSDKVTLLVGYSADIEVILQSKDNTLRIPTEAVMENNRVLVLNTETMTLEEQTFEPGLKNWTFTEVKSGLAAGQQVVLSLDAVGVEPGARVKDDASL